MRQIEDYARQARFKLMISMRTLDWPLLLLVAAFVIVAPLPGITGKSITSPLLWISGLFVDDPFAAYQNAIATAAIKRPEYQKPLTAIDPGRSIIDVVTLRTPRELSLRDRNFDIWVGLADEVREACTGAVAPLRRLQEIFGLPPISSGKKVVTEIEVPRDGLFRPCVGQGDLASPTCDFEFADPPTVATAPKDLKSLSASDDQQRALADALDRLKTLRLAYDQLRFVSKHIWDSYQTGFSRDDASPSDYPYTGFPFTGMGWSYDWSSRSRAHFGASEFVIKRDAPIKIISEKTPAEFCLKAR